MDIENIGQAELILGKRRMYLGQIEELYKIRASIDKHTSIEMVVPCCGANRSPYHIELPYEIVTKILSDLIRKKEMEVSDMDKILERF